jgi:hypothetical protein
LRIRKFEPGNKNQAKSDNRATQMSKTDNNVRKRKSPETGLFQGFSKAHLAK